MASRLPPQGSSTSAYSTTSASATTSQSTLQAGTGEETDYDFEEEEEPDVVTGVYRPKRRIVLTKRTYLLVAFIIITGLGIAAIVMAFKKLGENEVPPPTTFSEACFANTMFALFSITAVTPIGFVILKFRIANLSIGFIYMFCLVLCIFFSAKSISHGYYSYFQDDQFTIREFASSQANRFELHNFWAAVQRKHQCCGTKDIDRVEDWPTYLNSTHLHESCCTLDHLIWLEKERTSQLLEGTKDEIAKSCGKGLARTRTRYISPTTTPQAVRMFSGFFLSLTPIQKEKLGNALRIVVEPERYLVSMMDVTTQRIKDDWKSTEAFLTNWKVFYLDSIWNSVADVQCEINMKPEDPTTIDEINTQYEREKDQFQGSNDICKTGTTDTSVPAETMGLYDGNYGAARDSCKRRTYKLEKNRNHTSETDDVFCNRIIAKYRSSVTTLGRKLLSQLDYLTSYIYELGEDSKTNKVKVAKRTWILWELPISFNSTDLYPYKLAANLLRVKKRDKKDVVDEYGKKMFYLSRGIAENIVLHKVIHDKVCEGVEEEHKPNFRRKVARDMNKRWRNRGPVSVWRNADNGLGELFVLALKKVVFACVTVAGSCIICVVIIAVIFWQYYSRIKAEEYANLALPKEFEVLHLRRGSMIDEVDIYTPNKRKKKKQINRVAPQQQQRRVPGPQQMLRPQAQQMPRPQQVLPQRPR